MRIAEVLFSVVIVFLPMKVSLAEVGQRQTERRDTAPRTFSDNDALNSLVPFAPEPHNYTPTLTAASNQGATGLISSVNFPGVVMGVTSYDYQHNGSMHHQVEIDEANDRVHFAWTHWDVIPGDIDQTDRFTAYNYWEPGLDVLTACELGGFITAPGNPTTVSGFDQRGGYTTIDLDASGKALLAFHQQDNPGGPYSSWVGYQPLAGQLLFSNNVATNPVGEEQMWPVIDASEFNDTGGGLDTSDVVHCITRDLDNSPNCAYYRGSVRPSGSPMYVWSVPVTPFTSTTISAVVTEDPGSDDVALVWTKRVDENSPGQFNNDVAYIVSTSNGADWVNGANLDPSGTVNITNYNASSSGRAFTDLAAIYDNSGELHVVWNERRVDNGELYYLNQCQLLHWSQSAGIRKIAVGYYEPGGANGTWNMNLSKMSISVGSPTATQMCDGDDIQDYLYVTYTKFGGETIAEEEDFSSGGYNNGELYWSISNDGGISWSQSVNLTNTKSPSCDTNFANRCASEHWASIARAVNDQAHIQYIADQDAGGIPFSEGLWTMNPVMYLCIDGMDLCPILAPNAQVALSSDPECEYNTTPGATKSDETLSIENIGNSSLTYNIVVTDDGAGGGWLSVSPGGGGNLAPGGAPDVHIVTMDASALAEGLYTGNITVNHNDAFQSAFSFDIAFFVFDSFVCPEDVVLATNNSTAKTGSNSLALEVSNVESFGRVNPAGGLWRPDTIVYTTNVGETDTVTNFNPLYDGSLAIGRLTNGGNDTIVYRDVFENMTQGNPGFRAITSLAVDTSAYGTGTGAAGASAVQTTVDSLIGVDVEYVFPQDQDSSEFVIIKWSVYNRTTSPITDLVVGSLVDFDVAGQVRDVGNVEGQASGIHPERPPNLGASNSGYNLVYQVGLDTDATGAPVATNVLSAGISAIQCNPAAGQTRDNATFVYPNSGVLDGDIYQSLESSGFLSSDSLTDLHSVIALDQNLDLNTTNDFGFYCVALVSSIVSEADLLNTTKKAWRYCFGWQLVPETVVVDFVAGEVVTFDYIASGSHEDGLAGGCCGCLVSAVGSPAGVTVDTPNDCIGTVTVDGNVASPGMITLRLQDLCSEYVDDCLITLEVACDCTNQGDVAPLAGPGDGVANVLDVVALIDEVFRSGPTTATDATCPRARGDIAPLATAGDGVKNVLDAVAMIDRVFRSGPDFEDPCNVGGTEPSPRQEGSVTIESIALGPNETGTVGIFIENDSPIQSFVLPLIARTVSGGAFYTSIDTSSWSIRGGGDAGDVYLFNDDLVDYSSPDQFLVSWIENFLGGTDIPIGTDVIPTVTLQFDVNGNEGDFEIDTLLFPPDNRLGFVSGLTDPSPGDDIAPDFTKGVVTVGPCEVCQNSQVYPEYLLVTPGGTGSFDVYLQDGFGDPIVGDSNVSLDFSECDCGDLVPFAEEYPNWPIVPAPHPSDSIGHIHFAIAGFGSCPGCSVVVHPTRNPSFAAKESAANGNVIAKVPVTSVDADGDSIVTPLDFIETSKRYALGHPPVGALDLDGNGVVNDDDGDIHADHYGEAIPIEPCNRLKQIIKLQPDAGFTPGETISLIWRVTNNSDVDDCMIQQVDFYQAELDADPDWQIFATLNPSVELKAGKTYQYTILSYLVPDYGKVALRAVMTTDCCTVPQEATEFRDVVRMCPPDSVCYNFYAIVEPAPETIFTPLLPTGLNWTWEYSDIDTITNGMLLTICTSDFTPLGISGGVNVNLRYGPAWTLDSWVPIQFRVRHDVINSDVNQDCVVNVLDVVALIDYVFRSGQAPDPIKLGNVNCDFTNGGDPLINVLDVVYAIDYVFRSGPPPPVCEGPPIN